MSTGKELHLRCYTDFKDTSLDFDRLFGIDHSAYLFKRNTLISMIQVMTLHCKTKTMNIDLFLCEDQLSSEAATDSYTNEICNFLKCPNL